MTRSFFFWLVVTLVGASDLVRGDDGLVWENTRPGVSYVGTQQCIRCHQDQHASYLNTTHSVATTKTDPGGEPGPATFDHALSGGRYEVEHKNGSLIHREIMRDREGHPISVTEEAIAYSVGSGTHGKSYLYKSGNFLAQSPLTWYSDTGTWHLAPGYDQPMHKSFRRKIAAECLFCHVGSIDQKEHNPYDFEIVETTIGCERCHGPGELHVKKFQHNPDTSGDDNTIVNPARLSRELGEGVCQQCHLQGLCTATVSGKGEWDFRPGLPLTDFRIDYQYRLGNEKMRIVGHVEQMHGSRCYQQTETLTCVTCHHPHQPVAAKDRVEFYRSTCLQCHEDQACGKPLQQRMELANNSCYQCHMPKAETNVAHAAFHHHRIGVHDEDDELSGEPTNGLKPVLPVTALSRRERERCAAVAKVNLIRKKPGLPGAADLAMQATGSLIQLKQTGPLDALANSKLAWLADAQGQREIAEQLAQETLSMEPRPTLARIDATSVLAHIAFQKGDKQQAVRLYRQVTQQDRDSYELYYLGLCENNVGDTTAAIAALNQSIQLDPLQVSAHAALQAIYQAKGQPDKAAEHEQAAQRNRSLRAKLRQAQPR